MKDFVVINFGKHFKFTREKFYSKLSEEENLIKVVKSLYILLTTPDEVENILTWCNQVLLVIIYVTIMLRFS